MILVDTAERGASLMLIEGGLTLIAVAFAFYCPDFASTYFSHIEHALAKIARNKRLAVVTVGLSAFLLRVALLPVCPIPKPFVQDDFSFLLAADTFASGRLTNPTPAMWTHFESFQITMKPTYMSMYFPAQGLILAAGKVLTGHAWFGLLIVTALMSAATCWMLQAWLPPTWAFLGGMLAVLRLGLFSYWINTYMGGGSVAALGGALVLGALPRFMRTLRLRDSLLMAGGIILLATSRPYEGVLLCLPVVIVLGRWLIVGKTSLDWRLLLRGSALPIALILAAGIWMAYYDNRVFGHALTPPYKIDRATYAVVPYWIWQSPSPEPLYRHKTMRDFYVNFELAYFLSLRTLTGFLSNHIFFKLLRAAQFFTGAALIPAFIMLRRVVIDRRIRFLVICTVIAAIGVLSEVFVIPHYLAPFMAAFYAVGLQAMRHLRRWKPGRMPVGLSIVRLMVLLCVLLAVIRIWAQPLNLGLADWPSGAFAGAWYGSNNFGGQRANIENSLEQLAGKQLVIVRYTATHNTLEEWVYNAPDIDGAKVVWAREMDDADNLVLIHYYKDRAVWLVQPDQTPARLTPYIQSGAPKNASGH